MGRKKPGSVYLLLIDTYVKSNDEFASIVQSRNLIDICFKLEF